jgi:hypothetical protein
LISFEEKKSAAPGKTLPFYFAVAVEILISNFKGNIDATPASIPPGLLAIERSFRVFLSPIVHFIDCELAHRLCDTGQYRRLGKNFMIHLIIFMSIFFLGFSKILSF